MTRVVDVGDALDLSGRFTPARDEYSSITDVVVRIRNGRDGQVVTPSTTLTDGGLWAAQWTPTEPGLHFIVVQGLVGDAVVATWQGEIRARELTA